MVEALGIDVKVIIFAIVNFLVLFGVLSKFLYKPFIKLLDDRKRSVMDSFENAELMNRKADEKFAAYTKKLERAEEDGKEIIRASKQKADEQAQLILDEANEKAAQILKQAEEQIEREKELALAEMKDQIAELSMMAASKIIEKELGEVGQEAIIDELIEKAGNAEWQN